MNNYISRTLDHLTEDGHVEAVSENEIGQAHRAQVILGDPGIGKSELFKTLACRFSTHVTLASSLMWSEINVSVGKPVLIDGLDELAERREGDALAQVLVQLGKAGWPNFILSCRAADWDLRGEHDLKSSPLGPATVYNLRPFSASQALLFLQSEFPSIAGEAIIEHLSDNDLEELMGNPLTLGLLGRIAEEEKGLPISKGDLFSRATSLLVQEENEQYENSPQSQDPDKVLEGAGSLCAAYLMTGASLISRQSAAKIKEGEIRALDVENLLGGQLVRAALGTRIFRSVGKAEKFTPVHRVIAEYLGARWLAQKANNPKSQRRLLGLISSLGAVPASLRGLHAWLAYHSTELACRVVETDPYGVLRYTGGDGLSRKGVSRLFTALQNLANDNPYFRAGDLRTTSIKCLMQPEFLPEIRATLLGIDEKPFHLRVLFSEGLKGTDLVGDLAQDLNYIVLSQDHSFAERNDAAEAIWEMTNSARQAEIIEELRRLADPDSTRLAVELLESVEFSSVGVTHFVDVLLADMGLSVVPADRSKIEKAIRIRHFDNALEIVPDDSIPELLDYLADAVDELSNRSELEHDVSKLVLSLVLRALELGISDVERLWNWLKCLSEFYNCDGEFSKNIADILQEKGKLRRRLLLHIAFFGEDKRFSSRLMFYGRSALSFLNPSIHDIEWLIRQTASMSNAVTRNRELWMHLINVYRKGRPLPEHLHLEAKVFAGRDQELNSYYKRALQFDPQPEWEIREEKRQAAFNRRKKDKFARVRASYADSYDELKIGRYDYLYNFTKVYLGLYLDVHGEDDPVRRLKLVYGDDLTEIALQGFEAVLFREDLPNVTDVSKIFSENHEHHCLKPILVALLEREKRGCGFDDIPKRALDLALRALQEPWMLGNNLQVNGLREILEKEVLVSTEAVRSFLKSWMEPAFRLSVGADSGLYRLTEKKEWFYISSQLAEEWLREFVKIPLSTQKLLLKVLIKSESFEALSGLINERSEFLYPDIDTALLWLAVEFHTNFDPSHSELHGIAEEHPEFLLLLNEFARRSNTVNQLWLSASQAYFIVSEFRRCWPNVDRFGGPSWGSHYEYEAAEFIRSAINTLSHDISDEALVKMDKLVSSPQDTYTSQLKFAKSNQRQQLGESTYITPKLEAIRSVLSAGQPKTRDDLFVTVLDIFNDLQAWLHGAETSPLKNFWPNGKPLGEEATRDLIVDYLQKFCAPLGIEMITERRMLRDKRADIIFQSGAIELPVEAKGQWHKDLWTAASSQLDRLYTKDPKGGGYGIYIVFWYGKDVPAGKKIRKIPEIDVELGTPEKMKETITGLIPPQRRSQIGVVVLNLGHN